MKLSPYSFSASALSATSKLVFSGTSLTTASVSGSTSKKNSTKVQGVIVNRAAHAVAVAGRRAAQVTPGVVLGGQRTTAPSFWMPLPPLTLNRLPSMVTMPPMLLRPLSICRPASVLRWIQLPTILNDVDVAGQLDAVGPVRDLDALEDKVVGAGLDQDAAPPSSAAVDRAGAVDHLVIADDGERGRARAHGAAVELKGELRVVDEQAAGIGAALELDDRSGRGAVENGLRLGSGGAGRDDQLAAGTGAWVVIAASAHQGL